MIVFKPDPRSCQFGQFKGGETNADDKSKFSGRMSSGAPSLFGICTATESHPLPHGLSADLIPCPAGGVCWHSCSHLHTYACKELVVHSTVKLKWAATAQRSESDSSSRGAQVDSGSRSVFMWNGWQIKVGRAQLRPESPSESMIQKAVGRRRILDHCGRDVANRTRTRQGSGLTSSEQRGLLRCRASSNSSRLSYLRWRELAQTLSPPAVDLNDILSDIWDRTI